MLALKYILGCNIFQIDYIGPIYLFSAMICLFLTNLCDEFRSVWHLGLLGQAGGICLKFSLLWIKYKHQKEMLFVMDPEMLLNQVLDNNCEMYRSAEKKRSVC